MKRWVKGLSVGAITAIVGVGLGLTPLGDHFEKHVGLAWLFKIRGPIDPPAEVAVIAINERAAKGLKLSALPREWPRATHARLIEKLVKYGASVIVFDVDFQRPRMRADDLEFANAVASAGRVVLFENLVGKREPVFDSGGQAKGSIWIEQRAQPYPALANAAAGLAPFPVPKVQVNVFQFWAFKSSAGDAATMPAAALQVHIQNSYPRWREVWHQVDEANGLPKTRDGLTDAENLRALMLHLRRGFKNHPEFAARIHSVLNGEFGQRLTSSENRLAKALIGLHSGQDNRYLNFYGPPGTIQTIPYDTVMIDNTGQNTLDFTNKVVFVGFSDLYDPGQPDRFYTVFTRDDGVDLSGVEIAATAFGNLLTRQTLKASDGAKTTAILLLFGLTLGALAYLLPAFIGIPLTFFVSGLYAAFAQYSFNTADTWLPLATPIFVQLPIALLIGLFSQYLLERGRQKRANKAVSYYLPESVVKELTDNELDPSSLNTVVYGVCLATDMSGFTSISETMAPDELASFMNAYFDLLAETLKRHHVDVTEFHADTIMCTWTAKDPAALHRDDAALAGLALIETVDQFNQQSGSKLYPRIGLEEGWFYLGHTGGGGRLGYSILGDCANTAARIESLNKTLHTHVLATQPVVENASELLLRPLGEFILVGKSDPIAIIEILAQIELATEDQKQLCRHFAEGLDFFQGHQWSKAEGLFEAISNEYPQDGPTGFYLNRCRDYLTQSPTVSKSATIHMDVK